jgi:hypothetical protein
MTNYKYFERYGCSEMNISSPKFKKLYPRFSPDSGSFNRNKYEYSRRFETYSTYDYQIFTNSKVFNSDAYRDVMFRGIKLFQDKIHKKGGKHFRSITDPEGLDDDLKIRKVIKKQTKRFLKKTLNRRGTKLKKKIKDIAEYIYGPYNVISSVNNVIRTIYHTLRLETIQSAIFTYYYFYYYFFFTEYNLEHLFLYFPMIKFFVNYQLFANYSQFYFNFFEIFLGSYMPFLVFFLFSQYHIFKAFFSNRIYFITGLISFSYIFSLVPIYYFTGYSNIFFFTIGFLFFTIFSIFYIFEYSSSPQHVETNFIFSSYFLPVVINENSFYQCKKDYFLPIYYYKFKNWQFLNNVSPTHESNKNKKNRIMLFYISNLGAMSKSVKRIKKYNYFYLKYKSLPNLSLSPNFPISSLIFPVNNFNNYSFDHHREFLRTYPHLRHNPYAVPTDWKTYHFPKLRGKVPGHAPRFINPSLGYSMVGFTDFIYGNCSFKSFNADFTNFYAEYKDINIIFPSNVLFSYLYPYIAINIWINSFKPVDKEPLPPLYTKGIPYYQINKSNKTKIPSSVPKCIIIINDIFFNFIEMLFNKITFYRGYKFQSCYDSHDLISAIKTNNRLISKNKHYSSSFYVKLGIFIFKNFKLLVVFIGDRRNKLQFEELFTLMLILKQLEELFLLLIEKDKLYCGANRHLNFCIAIVKKSIESAAKAF